jgi:hypothetical protein
MGLSVINNKNSESMKLIFMSIWCVLSISCFAQETVAKNEIHYKNVCFNDICLGNDIRTMIKKWGNPDSTYIVKYNDIVDGLPVILREYYYFDSSDHKKYMKVVTDDNVKDKIIQFVNVENNKFQFEDKSTNQVIRIDDDTIKLKKAYPLSYSAACKFRARLIKEYTQWHQRDSQMPTYQTDKDYKQKIDKEYENRVKWTNIDVIVNISNAIDFYGDGIDGIGFQIADGKVVMLKTYFEP